VSPPTVRVAAIQATPVILDAEATVEKAIGLLEQAKADGVQLAVFPETFVPVYPSDAWAKDAAGFEGFDELWERLWENSLEVPGTLVERLIEACSRLDIHCAIGVTEREPERSGSLYNTLLLIGPEGLLTHHRKLMPTLQERLLYGLGSTDGLEVVETPAGRVGGLICWENMMPLARYAVYRQRPQIWVAPTVDDTGGWLASMRHIALESGAFVITSSQFIPASAFPDDFPAELPKGDAVFGTGGSAIIEPTEAEVIAGPLHGEEGIVIADCDLRLTLRAKRWFDPVGHYSREDALIPLLDPAAGQQNGSPPPSPQPLEATPGQAD
jgi:nitrilase